MIMVCLHNYKKLERISESPDNTNKYHHEELSNSEKEISINKRKSINLLDLLGIQELLQAELHNYLKSQENNNSKFNKNQDKNMVKNMEKNIEKNTEKNTEKNLNKNYKNNHNNPEITARILLLRRY